jgi:hypothetical protein
VRLWTEALDRLAQALAEVEGGRFQVEAAGLDLGEIEDVVR